MKAVWLRYLVIGALAVVGYALLPIGLGREALFCLVGASGAAAIILGVRRNRPAHPAAWYLLAAGMASWTLGSALNAWYQQVLQVETFPTPADAPSFATYPLISPRCC